MTGKRAGAQVVKVTRSEAMKAAWARRKAAAAVASAGNQPVGQLLGAGLSTPRRSVLDVVKEEEARRKEWSDKEAETSAQHDRIENENGVMTLSAIQKLVELGAANGLSSFQYRGLQLTFKKRDDQTMTGASQARDTSERQERERRRHQTLVEANEAVTDDLDHLKVTDPVAYEGFIQSEDVDEGDGRQ